MTRDIDCFAKKKVHIFGSATEKAAAVTRLFEREVSLSYEHVTEF